MRDRALADRLNEQIDRYHSARIEALERRGNPMSNATTLVVLAALDGLVLQKRLDPSRPMDEALSTIRAFACRKED